MREISLHILDLVQNGLEAGASRVGIEVHEDRKSDALVVKVCDNGRGMTAEDVKQAVDPFFTTRSVRRIGLGLALLKLAAEQSEGKLKLESQVGEGTTVTASFRYSHWDRAPLGDMATTLMVILAGNPKLNLTYQHTVDQARFDFDTDEVRQRLEDVPINHPRVLDWLRDYFQQSINKLYRGDQID